MNESPEDLAAETAAAKQIEAKWKCEVLKLQPFVYGVDWALMRKGALHSWGEFKLRRYARHAFPTLDLSLGKWLRLRWNSERSMVPHALYIQWEGEESLYYKSWPHLSGLTYRLGTIENRRGQPGDREPAILIPISEFKPLVAIEKKTKS